MQNPTETLKTSLAFSSRIAVVGIGTELRADDAAGILAAKKVRDYARRSPALKERIRVFLGYTAPENMTGDILRFQPTTVILIDAAKMGRTPGSIDIIDHARIDGISGSTHQIPLSILVDYFTQSGVASVLIIGIEPKEMGEMAQPSEEVRAAAAETAAMVCRGATPAQETPSPQKNS